MGIFSVNRVMKKSVLENREIYRIGNKVLKSVRLSDEEIDRIVAAPHLVDQVRAAMGSGRAVAEPVLVSNDWRLRYTLRRQNAWAAVAGGFVFALATGLFTIAGQNYIGRDLAGMVPPAEVPQTTAGVVDVPELDVKADEPPQIRPAERETARTAKTRSQVKPLNPAKEIEMGEFQALTYSDKQDEPGEGGRIVRVELSPASLFAMGVDIAVENDGGKVKADLLIGADGVMKSVRVEKRN